jgi:hypothetical protein
MSPQRPAVGWVHHNVVGCKSSDTQPSTTATCAGAGAGRGAIRNRSPALHLPDERRDAVDSSNHVRFESADSGWLSYSWPAQSLSWSRLSRSIAHPPHLIGRDPDRFVHSLVPQRTLDLRRRRIQQLMVHGFDKDRRKHLKGRVRGTPDGRTCIPVPLNAARFLG